MRIKFILKAISLVAVFTAFIFGLNALPRSGSNVSAQNTATPGGLQVLDPKGQPKADCPLKHTGSQVLRIMEVSRSIIYVVEDAVEITLIEQTKCITVALRGPCQNIFFVEFFIQHA